MRLLLAALACVAVAAAAYGDTVMPLEPATKSYPTRLSDYGLFQTGTSKPNPALVPYTLNTPLFSDYAEKQRFIRLPAGKKIAIGPENGKLIFPDGTILVKNFGYPDSKGALKLIETRLLLRVNGDWVALPYFWRGDGSDADLKLAGARIPVDTVLADGRKVKISYAVPNKNQCKLCHGEAGAVVPIGPRLGNISFSSGYETPFPEPLQSRYGSFDWRSDTRASLNDRARSYLDINCAHCHNPKGSASNSGLFLGRNVTSAIELGIGKRPVAAGRGAGDLTFVIEPGHPERSILLQRMKSIEPGIAMPELGRATVHVEGAALLKSWINAMED